MADQIVTLKHHILHTATGETQGELRLASSEKVIGCDTYPGAETMFSVTTQSTRDADDHDEAEPVEDDS